MSMPQGTVPDLVFFLLYINSKLAIENTKISLNEKAETNMKTTKVLLRNLHPIKTCLIPQILNLLYLVYFKVEYYIFHLNRCELWKIKFPKIIVAEIKRTFSII